MEVELKKKYPLGVSSDRAWAVLADIRAVAGCMPGAQITEQVDAVHYKGLVRSKVGPATMSFTGDIEVLGLDAAERRLELLGKGADKGGSSAAMKLVARLEPGADAASCVLLGDATVTVSGKLAQFGGRLLVPIADAMLAQFAVNFEAAAVAAGDAPQTVGASAAPVAETSPDATPMAPVVGSDATAQSPSATPAEATPPVPAALNPAAASEPRPIVASPSLVSGPTALPAHAATSPANELNALGLLWLVVRGWFLGLFGKKTA